MKIKLQLDDLTTLVFTAHEDGSVIKAYDTNPCSLCRSGVEDIHFHGSELGACSRKTYYFKMYGKQDQGFNSLNFLSDGHLHEASMLRNIEQGLPEGYEIHILENNAEQVTDVLGWKLVTHCDAFLINRKERSYVAIIECKAVKPKYFKEIKDKEEIRNEWYGQGQSYLFALKENILLFIVKNREDSKIHIPIKIEKDMVYISGRINKLNEVFNRIKNNLGQPEREHTNQKDFECQFCPFKGGCWNV